MSRHRGAMDDFNERLATAQTPGAIHEHLVHHVRNRLPVTGIHFMPFAPAPAGAATSVMYLGDEDPAPYRGVMLDGVHALQAEPGLPDLFEQPRCALRVELALGWERWRRSSIYQEYFRPMRSARQLVVGLTDASKRPRAFMAVARSEADAALTIAEERLVLALRDRAERALLAFDLVGEESARPEVTLDAITAALPVPALLTNGRQLGWMNREAELRLGLAALSFGRSRYYGGRTAAVDDLLRRVRGELDDPGLSLKAHAGSSSYAWLTPGESIVIRRLDDRMPGWVLVCLTTPAPPPRTGAPRDESATCRLSAREADIAHLAGKGFTVLNIASQLNIAESTVCTHLKRIYRKLRVRSRAELAWQLARGQRRADGELD